MANIPGSPGPDTLTGTDLDDTITALGGDDLVNDLAGNDLVFGGAGDDSLISGGGNDSLNGGDGDDVIVINTALTGGPGVANGGDGADLVRIFGTSGGTLRGGLGVDVIDFVAVNSRRLVVDLDASLMDGGAAFGPGVAFSGFERLFVTSFGGNDSILGGGLADILNVGGGRNLVDAKAGDDAVSYTARDANTLMGGAGDDTLTVNSGASSLYFIVNTFDGSVDDGSLSDISGFEQFIAHGGALDDIASLGTGNDAFHGGGGGDTAFGGGGDDLLTGGRGNDALEGGEGDDVLRSGTGDDALLGGGGKDRIRGGAGADSIDGGAGADRIQFARGNDTATGGAGADSFLFTRPETGNATITDFATAEDLLVFSSARLPGSSGAALLSLGAATGPDGQFVLTYTPLTDTTALLWDRNGDRAGGMDLLVRFTGNVTIVTSDIFML